MPDMMIEQRDTDQQDVRVFVASKMLSPNKGVGFYSVEEAAGDAAVAALFAIEGVTGVLLVNDRCTVRIAADGDWTVIAPAVEATMREQWRG